MQGVVIQGEGLAPSILMVKELSTYGYPGVSAISSVEEAINIRQPPAA